MYFPKSADIANAHPTLAGIVEQVDAVIYEQGADPIRVDDAAGVLSVDPDTLKRILLQFVQVGLLRREERQYCSNCECLVEDVDSSRECDNCEANLAKHPPDVVEVFSVVEPIRINVDDSDSNDEREEWRIVFVGGDRGGGAKAQLQLPKELRRIKEAIQLSTNRDLLRVADSVFSASLQELATLYTESPRIVHFGGHGDDRSLVLIRDRELIAEPVAITSERLAKIFGNYTSRVAVCVLNVCESDGIAKHLISEEVVDFAIGWKGQVPDAAAITFSEQLYRHIGNGLSLFQAFTFGEQCAIPDHAAFSVHLMSKSGCDPKGLSLFTQ